ncbi:unnamed protein product [Calicophoron daubneyi]|uniref:Transmembrane protein 120B n=1 Tax=Calicophoron daubneyi TaxID=300641 RepID=A0AAV2TDD4_CALDB
MLDFDLQLLTRRSLWVCCVCPAFHWFYDMEGLDPVLRQFYEQWKTLQTKYKSYMESVEKTKDEQSACLQSVKHCRSYMHFISKEIQKLHKSADADLSKTLVSLQMDLENKESLLQDVEEVLPRQPGMYLRVVLGALNISFANKQDKFAYKNDYEQFKIVVSAISAVMAFLLSFVFKNRIMDAVFHFLLVWYYCTLTIRERILIANGSRIKGWWNIYHFIATACAGIMLIWPCSQSYDEFRDQFMLYSLYLNGVHFIQYQYQVGCLYKLRALGDRHPMDITVDGFMSWMFRRLTFTLPFLFVAYGFELYNAWRLYNISTEPYCHEWQVLAVSIIYFVLAMGNIITVCLVIRQKIFARTRVVVRNRLRRKYSTAYYSGSECSSSGREPNSEKSPCAEPSGDTANSNRNAVVDDQTNISVSRSS